MEPEGYICARVKSFRYHVFIVLKVSEKRGNKFLSGEGFERINHYMVTNLVLKRKFALVN